MILPLDLFAQVLGLIERLRATSVRSRWHLARTAGSDTTDRQTTLRMTFKLI
jgi:hypothetical protein